MTDQMTWDGTERGPVQGYGDRQNAIQVIAWIELLGGEARYEPEYVGTVGHSDMGPQTPPRIVITGPDGDLIVQPGDTVHDTDEDFFWYPRGDYDDQPFRLRLFRVERAQ